jgi:COX assembly mitochondrial protein 1
MSHVAENRTASELTSEKLKEGRNSRVPYLEMREVEVQKIGEESIAKQVVGKEIRDLCRPEIDEYIDCVTDRMFTILKCKPLAMKMRKCVAKYELHTTYAATRIEQVLQERNAENENTPADINYRSQFNKCYVPDKYEESVHKL